MEKMYDVRCMIFVALFISNIVDHTYKIINNE